MFKVRTFLILAVLFAATIAFTWYSFRRTNFDANKMEDGIDVSAPFYETPASAPYGEHSQPGHTEPKENEIRGGEKEDRHLLDSSVNDGIKNTEQEKGH